MGFGADVCGGCAEVDGCWFSGASFTTGAGGDGAACALPTAATASACLLTPTGDIALAASAVDAAIPADVDAAAEELLSPLTAVEPFTFTCACVECPEGSTAAPALLGLCCAVCCASVLSGDL